MISTGSEPKPTAKPKVLELRQVTYQGRSANSIQLRDVDLVIRAGDSVIVHLQPTQKTREAVSMLQGLVAPAQGEIRFQGQDWTGDAHDQHFQMRSRIGRVFEGQAWIQNLTIHDNVILAAQHHAILPATTDQTFAAWTKRFEVENLGNERPAFVESSRLQIYQWIRALMIKPALLILERPMQSVAANFLPTLISAVDEARRGGAAALWFTSSSVDDQPACDPPCIHLELHHESLRLRGAATDE